MVQGTRPVGKPAGSKPFVGSPKASLKLLGISIVWYKVLGQRIGGRARPSRWLANSPHVTEGSLFALGSFLPVSIL